MQNQVTSPTARKWQRYNRWRAGHIAVDRARRLARLADRKAAFLDGYDAPKFAAPKPPKAWARVRIYFADGTSAGFAIHETPFGKSISPTLAGRKLTTLLQNK